jgi:hypothetical protein
MNEQEVRETLKMLNDLFPLHPRSILALSPESVQEILALIERMVPALKTMVEGQTREVVPND